MDKSGTFCEPYVQACGQADEERRPTGGAADGALESVSYQRPLVGVPATRIGARLAARTKPRQDTVG